nr:DUF3304 domain-containing protein [Pseudomonas syringae]
MELLARDASVNQILIFCQVGFVARIRKTLQQGLFILLGSALSGCSSASNEMAGGNLQAVNHTVHGINWMSVNGYRADGGPQQHLSHKDNTEWR